MNFLNYSLIDPIIWSGRIDGLNKESMRWHQLIEFVDLREEGELKNSIVFLGFCSDEGVRRNQGRIGAKDAPQAFRKIMANLPVHFSEKINLKDAGDICCKDGNLEEAQSTLSELVAKVIHAGGFPVVLGGGHEVTYGHFQGIKKACRGRKIGIINIDAHLDIRESVNGQGNSGTGFYQIAEECENENAEFQYLAIGIQEISNTNTLFSYAADKEVSIISADELQNDNLNRINLIIKAFANQVDYIYLTIDMDAFDASHAPGVSSPAFNGIVPDAVFFKIFDAIKDLPNLVSMDIAELNPIYDIDNRTARLGALLLFKLLNSRL